MKQNMIFAFRTCRYLALAGVLASAAMVPAHADIVNGTFAGAVGGPHPGSFETVGAGDASTIPGWTVTPGTIDPGGGSVDWINQYWTAPGVTQSIDLDGNTPGGIEQTVSTISGASYTLTFELSQNPDGGGYPANTNTLNILIGNTLTPLTIVGHSAYNTASGYQAETFSFTANSSSTLIGFVSTDPANDPYGAVVADVNLTPEPDFRAFLAIGLLGLFVFAQRRRNSRSSLSPQ